MAFHFRHGKLFCEDINLERLMESLPTKQVEYTVNGKRITVEAPPTPVFVYSKTSLQNNVTRYKKAMKDAGIENGHLGYAIKANGNPSVLKILREAGVQMLVTVSGNEILLGLACGFDAKNIIFNGNGKQRWELKLAMEEGTLINVDSSFDALNLIDILENGCKGVQRVDILLRIQPPPLSENKKINVHSYVNTSGVSKFGFPVEQVDEIMEILLTNKKINVIGIHCHLGSCITQPHVYGHLAKFAAETAQRLEQEYGISLQVLNVGGGISINYDYNCIPGMTVPEGSASPNDLTDLNTFMTSISEHITAKYKIIMEPGRSLVGDTCVLVSTVIGCKEQSGKTYLVIDGAMTEVIRPCLYGSRHQIFPTSLEQTILEGDNEWKRYDVVGPICEAADFVGKNIQLPHPLKSKYVVIMDVGAYCAAMGSNYNMRPKPAEIMIAKESWKYIRERDSLVDLVSRYGIELSQ